MSFGLKVLLAAVIFWLVVILLVRGVPVVRRRRVVVLDRPKPCTMAEAQRALDRLVDAGCDAEIVEDDDNGINMWANVKAATEVKPTSATSSKSHGSRPRQRIRFDQAWLWLVER